MPVHDRGRFESLYAGQPRWEIGRPQRALLAVADRITGSVLDAGCGTGENALYFASRGQKVTGSPSWVRRLKQRQKATGSLAPRPPGPGRPVTLAPHDARPRELVRDDPDATLAELRDRLGVRVSISALSEYLRRIRLSFKKKSSGRPSRTGRT
jgi:SAM-dependent methyltransferase